MTPNILRLQQSIKPSFERNKFVQMLFQRNTEHCANLNQILVAFRTNNIDAFLKECHYINDQKQQREIFLNNVTSDNLSDARNIYNLHSYYQWQKDYTSCLAYLQELLLWCLRNPNDDLTQEVRITLDYSGYMERILSTPYNLSMIHKLFNDEVQYLILTRRINQPDFNCFTLIADNPNAKAKDLYKLLECVKFFQPTQVIYQQYANTAKECITKCILEIQDLLSTDYLKQALLGRAWESDIKNLCEIGENLADCFSNIKFKGIITSTTYALNAKNFFSWIRKNMYQLPTDYIQTFENNIFMLQNIQTEHKINFYEKIKSLVYKHK